jgi:hypothetical protein
MNICSSSPFSANDDCLYRSRASSPLSVDPKNIGRPFSRDSDSDEGDKEGDDDTRINTNRPSDVDALEVDSKEFREPKTTLANYLKLKKPQSTAALTATFELEGTGEEQEVAPRKRVTFSRGMVTRSTKKLKALKYFTSSKYDFVKVKILIQEEHSKKLHSSILSRYIVRRILTFVNVRSVCTVRMDWIIF